MDGAVLTRFLDEATCATLRPAIHRFKSIGPGTGCAGADYARIIDGEQHFTCYQRVLPWDHAPGTLLLTEAGGTARWLDRSNYSPDKPRSSLLVAAGTACWQAVWDTLAPVLRPPGDRPEARSPR